MGRRRRCDAYDRTRIPPISETPLPLPAPSYALAFQPMIFVSTVPSSNAIIASTVEMPDIHPFVKVLEMPEQSCRLCLSGSIRLLGSILMSSVDGLGRLAIRTRYYL